jgi:hypothetical protein
MFMYAEAYFARALASDVDSDVCVLGVRVLYVQDRAPARSRILYGSCVPVTVCRICAVGGRNSGGIFREIPFSGRIRKQSAVPYALAQQAIPLTMSSNSFSTFETEEGHRKSGIFET